jgi:hypothetical protein
VPEQPVLDARNRPDSHRPLRTERRLRARVAIGEPAALCDQSQRQTGTRENMMSTHEAVPGRRAEAPRALAANLVGGHLVVPTYLIAA